ncbi:DUF255 domain-containing protein [Rhizobium lentis]|uniref:DUF255 domain-containing protein n=1 Tax=Rhizobium lentis TaxID=1138194 RepID=A0A7W8XCW7_9HYPH|nr:DUF255 domain-containing protein [Rhizobium lentis]MBB4572418.1 hypothetical protein [Rhizobium lentis]MBB5548391.1 hypothetical protein [Rhizobium lentis]MBB5558921.1 hypothetical protein [Rhizobium lentis]MBB5565556.1 hypothetical protein [Rhizobium lentis]
MISLKKTAFACAALVGAIGIAAVLVPAKPSFARKPIEIFPRETSETCRDGDATLYDQCSDQVQIYRMAMAKAVAEHKTVLVSYGAEWCIWCHVFDAYIHGETDKFTYRFGSPSQPVPSHTATLYERPPSDISKSAERLNAYVADNFVVLHIDQQYANGMDVLDLTDAAKHLGPGIPFIFTLDGDGKFAAELVHDTVEMRRDSADWYRGYERDRLLTSLTAMRNKAQVASPLAARVGQ